MKTRRQFLRSSLLGVSTLWTMPAFIEKTMANLQEANEANSATQAVTGRDNPILVIVQLGGGNDGINTVIPYGESNYHRSRPAIRIGENEVRKLDDQLGLHPSLGFLEESFNEGEMAIINGVGYPNPNRSHFRSTDIWSIGSNSSQPSEKGWIGRFFDNECPGADAMRAVTMTGEEPLMLQGVGRHATSISDLSSFGFNGLDGRRIEDPLFRALQQPGNRLNANDNRDFVQRVALDTLVTSEQMGALVSRGGAAGYPSSGLAQQLSRVGNMIQAGATTRIYYVSHGGFDTHSNQAGRHAQLLQQLDQAVSAFVAHMKRIDEFNRVTLMTFSEFGRQLRQNGTDGTDHGAAAPMFLIGGGVRPGFHSEYPSLASKDLYANGDLRHSIDFRQVYASIIEQWLKANSRRTLGMDFDTIPLFA